MNQKQLELELKAKEIAQKLVKERNELLQLLKKLVLTEGGSIVIMRKKAFDSLVSDWERTTNKIIWQIKQKPSTNTTKTLPRN